MKRTCLFFVFLLCILSSWADSPLNVSSRLRLRQQSQAKHCPSASRLSLSRDTEEPEDTIPAYHPLILQVDNAETIDSLIDMGVIIYHSREDMLLTSVPRDTLEAVLDLEGVYNAALSTQMCMAMDAARPASFADLVQTGYSLPQDYDGTGVVVGFSDIGFDPSHVAFTGRVRALSDYDSANGWVRKASTPDQIAHWRTDDPDNYHATHVAGILAGGYMDNCYYGVATNAEIVGTTSRLNDVGILSGIEDIIAYAKEHDKPCVINLSLSSHLGPHDGTDLICRYLSSCAQDAIICISAGNSGKDNCYAYQDLSKGEGRVITSDRSTAALDVNGVADLWSDSTEPFEMRIEIFDFDTKNYVYATEWLSGDYEATIDAEADPQWGEYFSGKLLIGAETCSLNNRYNATVVYDTHTEIESARGPFARYRTAIAIRKCEGFEGPKVDMFADTSSSIFGKASDSKTTVSSDCSINDLCTADGVVSVGMYVSNSTVATIEGSSIGGDEALGTVSVYSSYSDISGVARLPHVCAPGKYVVSAFSGPFVESHPEYSAMASAIANVDSFDYYWIAASGTSMSSPYTAGVIALWLQADPHLTADRILEIIRGTSIGGVEDRANPRWGAGMLNAYTGMEAVLDPSALPFVITEPHTVNAYTSVAASSVIYNLQGIQISSPTAPGLYIINGGLRHIP